MIFSLNTVVVSNLATAAIMDTFFSKISANSCNLCIKVITLKAEPKSLQQSRENHNDLSMKKLSKEQMILCAGGTKCNMSEEQKEVLAWAALVCSVGSMCTIVGTALFAGPGLALALLGVICD